MSRINFELSIAPPKGTSQQKGVFVTGGRARFFKKKTVADAESLYMSELAKVGINSDDMLTGPIACEIIFTWPYRKSETKRRQALPFAMHDKRPDADNTAKLLLDCMEKEGFYKQDSEISILTIEKRWGLDPSVQVDLWELDEIGNTR